MTEGRAVTELGHDCDQAWRHDVALEMWIDTDTRPVIIRLAGVLDGSTGANVVDVVEDCLAEGMREFALDTTGLVVERSGWRVVVELCEHVHLAGGILQLDLGRR